MKPHESPPIRKKSICGNSGDSWPVWNRGITKSISKIFKTNFVCLLTNERYKTYQTGFSFSHLGHARGVGLWGTVGGWGVNFFFQNSTRVGVRVTYMNGTCNGTIFWVLAPPPQLGPWGGAKRSNIIKSQLISQYFKDFQTKLCVSTHK